MSKFKMNMDSDGGFVNKLWFQLLQDVYRKTHEQKPKQTIAREIIENYTEVIEFEEVTETKQLQ